jgi:hypothetical protein
MLMRLPSSLRRNPGCLLQAGLHRLESVAAGQAAEEDFGVRVVGTHLHIGQTDHADARVPELGPDHFGKLAANLLGDPVPARKSPCWQALTASLQLP